ncbi:hypothetical protein DESA109040_01460 [Deinococcus saxicola]|uniref:LysR family substrate-binding domain-containing protein n=1 Tax=Deinococcus saxicola TaxID=249406 RepID=UPI0039EDEA47
MPQVFRKFSKAHPGLVPVPRELLGAEQAHALLDGAVDAGFLSEPFVDDTLDFYPLLTDTFQAVPPERHPLATLPEFSLAALAPEAFLLHQADLVGRERASLIDQCRRAGFTPQVAYEGRQLQTILGMIASGRGVGLLRSAVLAMHRPVGVIHRPLTGEPLLWTLGLALRRENPLPIAQARIAAARAVAPHSLTLQ